MRKKLFFLFLMLATTFSSAFASIIDLDIEEQGKKSSGNGPRTISPSVQASAISDELILTINHFCGCAQVSVIDNAGNNIISNIYYINGHDNVDLDFTGYSVGQYEITINLGNGIVYSGSFRIE